MPFYGAMPQATGYGLEIISATDLALTVLGYGANNKLLEVALLNFTGNATTPVRTIGTSVKRLVFHANALAAGGLVTVRISYASNQVDLVANSDGVGVFDVT